MAHHRGAVTAKAAACWQQVEGNEMIDVGLPTSPIVHQVLRTIYESLYFFPAYVVQLFLFLDEPCLLLIPCCRIVVYD